MHIANPPQNKHSQHFKATRVGSPSQRFANFAKITLLARVHARTARPPYGRMQEYFPNATSQRPPSGATLQAFDIHAA